MGQAQCPVCYTALEVRAVTPCFVCGGWEGLAERLETATFREYRLPGGQPIVLCGACELEEFMVRGGWGYQLGLERRLPVNELKWVCEIERPQLGRDKFCPTCNLRLAFIHLVATASGDLRPCDS